MRFPERNYAQEQDDRVEGPRAWTGSWPGAPDDPGATSAVGAITRAIGAASGHGARGRTSHDPPVVGSSPTRPPADHASQRIAAQHAERHASWRRHSAAASRL